MAIREILIRCLMEKKGKKSGEILQYFCVQPWVLKTETRGEYDALSL